MGTRSWNARLVFACAVVMVIAALTAILLVSCSATGSDSSSEPASSSSSGALDPGSVEARGSIIASDGAVLADSRDVTDGVGLREYPLGSIASALVGSCYTQGAPDGIEQTYAEELLAGSDVTLTVDSRIQKVAAEALEGKTGAAVVLDPVSGAVLAMASSPSYDPQAVDADALLLENRATQTHIPGSTFKTITLAAALQNGVASLDERISAPAELAFPGGAVTNYDMMQYGDQTLLEAFAKSINTVFAQLSLRVEIGRIVEMAQYFGFDRDLMSDFPLERSSVLEVSEMEPLMQAWSGVGQALYQDDGTLQGPVMTAVQGAVIAGAIANGGVVVRPYVVSDVGGEPTECALEPEVLARDFLDAEVVSQVDTAMHAVVETGTGRSAAVPDVEVAGKTGTAETASGTDDGWFIGYARTSSHTYAISLIVSDSESSGATAIARSLISSLP